MGLSAESFGVRFKRGFQYSKQHYGNMLVIFLMLLFLVFLIMQPIAGVFSIHNSYSDEPGMRDILDLAAEFVKRIAQIYTDDYIIWANVLRQFVYIVFLLITLPLLVISMSFCYYSEIEKTEAKGLWKALKRFGKRSRSQEKNVDFD